MGFAPGIGEQKLLSKWLQQIWPPLPLVTRRARTGSESPLRPEVVVWDDWVAQPDIMGDFGQSFGFELRRVSPMLTSPGEVYLACRGHGEDAIDGGVGQEIDQRYPALDASNG